MLKTSNDWQKDYPSIIILDPDGWDRQNYDFSFNEELVSQAEFLERLSMSTCIFKGGLGEVK